MSLLTLPPDILRNCIFNDRVLDNVTLAVCRFVCKRLKNYILFYKFAIQNAAKEGYLEILKWARSNGCHWDESTCFYATSGGHLEVLKWARANGCPWNESTCAFAALKGHLEVLKWARSNGCPWDFYTCLHSAKGGHLEVLKWARENGCPR